jgi:predicted ATPase
LLRRLAVFPAGFTLEAAVAVMTHADDVAPVTDCIANLVAKSLVMLDRSETGTRWYLLETTRAYAHEKLEASGESPEIELRRAKFCLELFAPFGSEAQLRAAVDSLSRYRLEVDNLRAALEWCFGPAGNLEVGVRLAAAATPFFLALSLLPECHRWSARALRALDDRNGGGAAEMHLQAGLGISSMYTEGHSDQSKAALSRGLLLAEHLQDLINQFRIIGQLHSFHRRAGNFDQMLAVARQSEAVATRMGDPVLIAGAHSLLGVSHHLIGNQSEARAHLQKALAPATEASLAKARIFGFHRERPRIVLARTLWLLGYPDQARQLARETIDALGSAEPVTICIVLIWGACVFRWIGDLTSATQSIDRLLLHADLHALAPYKAVGHSLQGQLLIQRGDANAGVELLRSSLGTLSAERYELYGTELNSSLAQGLALIGQLDQALHTIDRMIAQLQQHGELFLPELQRIRGRILEQAADEQAAEQAFHQSIDQAEQQSARSWHLRTSMDLARLQFRQGRREEARKTLADSLDCFNEGFETADLRAAQRLLPTLS